MSSRPLTLAYVGFAFLGAAVLGAFVYERAGRAPPAPAPAPVPAPFAVTVPEPSAATVPAMRPNITLKDLDGHTHSLAEWDGKALIINFWATWCAPCRKEIPLLNRIRREYASKGFEIVGIAVDFADDVRAFTKDFPLQYPLLIGEEDGLAAVRAFGIADLAFPITAFTDTRGRVITIHLGELHAAQAEAILAIVARVNSGTLAPGAAREAVTIALNALPPLPKASSRSARD